MKLQCTNPNCKKLNSSKSEFCEFCGTPLKDAKKRYTKKEKVGYTIICLILSISMSVAAPYIGIPALIYCVCRLFPQLWSN